mmetsp:Transcript_16670/g.28224  ORF Transcript_16670/g.28224 Transcript_16670/m.28224 type:complete len:231 (-) Transcript_16670:15-707(-)
MFTLTLFLAASTAMGFSPVRSNAIINARSGASSLNMGVVLEDLPYDYTALEPMIGEQTLRIHHDKHHAKYVATTNEMIKGTDMEGDDVVTILRKAFNNNQGLFNNAAQSYNHDFYWKCMKSGGGGAPSGDLAAAIDKDFGSYENFRKEFTVAANTAFGSGWAWLVKTPTGLKVEKTIGANNPLTDEGSVPLLTIDVWEHAYYLDFQNMRATYVDTFLDKLVDWDAVAAPL